MSAAASNNPGEKIDIVYTWVDGSDPEWQKSKQTYMKGYKGGNGSIGSNRFRDNSELLYSLRSLEKYVDFVNNVYIVTCGQVPKWLNTSNPRIKVISHEDIFPNKKDLPTFNSNAIEMNIHRIPGLTKNFVYLNDDCHFANKITLDDFFEVKDGVWKTVVYKGNQGVPRRIQGCDHFYSIVFRGNELLNKRFGEKIRTINFHIPIIMNVDIMNDLHNTFPEQVKKTSSNRFRSDTDMQLSFLYGHFVKDCHVNGVPKYGFVEKGTPANSSFLCITYNKERVLRELSNLLNKRPKFVCMNDDKYGDDDAKNADMIETVKENYYEVLFPKPSEFELKITE